VKPLIGSLLASFLFAMVFMAYGAAGDEANKPVIGEYQVDQTNISDDKLSKFGEVFIPESHLASSEPDEPEDSDIVNALSIRLIEGGLVFILFQVWFVSLQALLIIGFTAYSAWRKRGSSEGSESKLSIQFGSFRPFRRTFR